MSREPNSLNTPWPHIGLLLLRVAASSLMLTHGIPKLQKLMAGGDIKFFDFLGLGPMPSLALAVFGEAIAPILVMLGLFTRFAAFPPAFTMAVAAVMVHGADPLGEKELALLYLLPFVTLMFTGPGRWSLDSLRTRRTGGFRTH
ncbi:MAG: DoxX family protein [Candidatus Eisenbacteria bacterium]